MATSSFSATSTATVTSVSAVTKPTSDFSLRSCSRAPRRVSFRLSSRPRLCFLSKQRNSYSVVKAQANKVGNDEPSNASAQSPTKSEAPSMTHEKEPESPKQSSSLATEESISEFLTQVTSLVKLVDSNDVVELQLKQLDCELTIRKKEALPQPEYPNQVAMMQSPPQSYFMPPVPSPAPPSPPPASSPAPSSPAPSPPPPVKSSLPTIKSPMAGTFYRCPGPSEPPFVKAGDKVQKGQVLCIIEAMKLMNEIEADQSGTIVEVLIEDGKPVSLDSPLFAIQP